MEAQFLIGRQEFARKTEDGSLKGVLKKKSSVSPERSKMRVKRKTTETLSKSNPVQAKDFGGRTG